MSSKAIVTIIMWIAIIVIILYALPTILDAFGF